MTTGAEPEQPGQRGGGFEESILTRHLQLQQVLCEISNDFINLAAEEIDQHIKKALGKLASFLGFNGAAITKLAAYGWRADVGHIWTAPGVTPVLETFTEKDFPWSAECIWQEKDVMLPTMDALPATASVDRATFERHDVRSSYSKVLRSGNVAIGVLALVSFGRHCVFPEDMKVEIDLFAQVLANALARQRSAIAISDALAFERMLTDVSRRLLECAPSRAGEEVGAGLRALTGFFGVDRCIFWELSPDRTRFTRVHSYNEGPGVLPVAVEVDSLPWFMEELSASRPISLESLSDLPADAINERRYWAEHGLKSALLVPLSARGYLAGCLSLSALKTDRQWPPDLVRRLQLAGELLVNALALIRTDEALRKSEERLSLAADAAGAGLWGLDLGTNRFWVTDRTREIFQLQGDIPVTYDLFLSLVHPQDRDLIKRSMEEMRLSGVLPRVDYRIVQRDAKIRWVSARGRVHDDGSGQAGYLTGVTVDITSQKLAEDTLRESEARFRTLVENAADGFELSDEEGRYIDVNSATLQQLGFTREEILRLGVFDVDPLLTPEKFAESAQALASGSPLRLESVHQRKDGGTFPVELTVSLIRLSGRKRILTMVRDITERKRGEEALLKSFTEMQQLKDRLQAESDYLKEEIKVTQSYGEVIGSSLAIRKVLHKVEQVAATDSSVLIRGETGAGKELIANAIHRGSLRKDQVMVMVNCAALPPGLVESELFGRERGAYTGALTRQAGRFEVADNSTLFLDEIGELSLEVQAKLLRVLELGEFERLGSSKTIKVNVRLIAATNHDLGEAVNERKFREDLYYRLNVFPIMIPPLRERVEDIPELVWAFVRQFGKRMGKKITKIPRKSMESLQYYRWPGNVRQLRNIIEHSVIISSAETLKLAMPEDLSLEISKIAPLSDRERDHILRALEITKWRIKGPKGAASRLGINPSTLYTRMKKLKLPTRREKLAL